MSLNSFSSLERSKNLIYQISSSFLIKGILFVITYIQFPVFNNFLTKEEFGLWMTFISFYNWFILFDFGIGHGLKNILSERLSYNDHGAVKKNSSSGIIGTILITLIFILFFEFIKFESDSSKWFITSVHSDFIRTSINFTFYSCIILFLHNTLTSFMHSIQKGSYANYLNLLVNVSLLGIVFITTMQVPKDAFSSPLVFLSQINFILYLAFFIIICFLFLKKYPLFIPDFRLVSWKYFKQILNTGLLFFFIQVSVLFIFPIDSFLLSNFVSTTSAGDYNIILKIYGIFIVAAAIINQSSWPSITEAFYKKDYDWLKQLFKKLLWINLILIVGIIILSYYLNEIITLWMGENYHFPKQTILVSALLHIFFIITTSLSTILYSTNFLKSQIVVGLILIVLKILLIYFLVINADMGLQGVLISSMVCFILFAILNSFFCIQKFRNI